MNSEPFFSIIMPIYNGEEYLQECIDSVLTQDYENYELIAINDGSTDRTLEILEEYKTIYPQIKIYTIKNSGVSNARNIGLRYSSGDFIIFLDCDDILAKGTLNRFAVVLAKKKYMVDIIFASQQVFEYDISEPVEIYAPKQERTLTTDEVLKMCFMRQIHNVVWGNTYKATLLKDNNIFFDKSYSMNEDGDWLVKVILKATNYIIINETAYYQRRNRNAKNYHKIGRKYAESSFCVNSTWYDYFKNEYRGPSKEVIKCRIANSYMFSAFRVKGLCNGDFKAMKELFLSRSDILEDVSGIKNKLLRAILRFFGFKAFLQTLIYAIILSNRKN